jgi:hypothetical protein
MSGTGQSVPLSDLFPFVEPPTDGILRVEDQRIGATNMDHPAKNLHGESFARLPANFLKDFHGKDARAAFIESHCASFHLMPRDHCASIVADQLIEFWLLGLIRMNIGIEVLIWAKNNAILACVPATGL